MNKMHLLTCVFLSALSFAPEILASCAVPLTVDIEASFPQGWSGNTKLVSYANSKYGRVYTSDVLWGPRHDDRCRVSLGTCIL